MAQKTKLGKGKRIFYAFRGLSYANPWQRRLNIIRHATGLDMYTLARLMNMTHMAVYRIMTNTHIGPGYTYTGSRKPGRKTCKRPFMPRNKTILAIARLEVLFAKEIEEYKTFRASRLTSRNRHRGVRFAPDAAARGFVAPLYGKGSHKFPTWLVEWRKDPANQVFHRLRRQHKKHSRGPSHEIVESWSRFENYPDYVPGRSLQLRRRTRADLE